MEPSPKDEEWLSIAEQAKKWAERSWLLSS
jgi:hypothetical protein